MASLFFGIIDFASCPLDLNNYDILCLFSGIEITCTSSIFQFFVLSLLKAFQMPNNFISAYPDVNFTSLLASGVSNFSFSFCSVSSIISCERTHFLVTSSLSLEQSGMLLCTCWSTLMCRLQVLLCC